MIFYKAEFLKLYKVVKAGAVAGLGKKTMFGSSSKKDAFRAVLADTADEFVATVRDSYDIGEELGKGRAGTVVRRGAPKPGIRTPAGAEAVAVKFVPKSGAAAGGEVAALTASAGHPGVVRLWESFEEREDYALVTELVQGGALSSRVGNLPEDEVTPSKC